MFLILLYQSSTRFVFHPILPVLPCLSLPKLIRPPPPPHTHTHYTIPFPPLPTLFLLHLTLCLRHGCYRFYLVNWLSPGKHTFVKFTGAGWGKACGIWRTLPLTPKWREHIFPNGRTHQQTIGNKSLRCGTGGLLRQTRNHGWLWGGRDTKIHEWRGNTLARTETERRRLRRLSLTKI